MSEMIKSLKRSQNMEPSYNYIEKQFELAKEAGGNGKCPICKGKGMLPELVDGNLYFKPCNCVIQSNNKTRIEKSGLAGVLDKYTFDRYKTNEPWQVSAKSSAQQFVESPKGWFFIGGQVGSGKTHLCTAIVSGLMEKGFNSRYIIWPSEVIRLKANKNNDQEYERLIRPLQETCVLYIDDFFKTEKGKTPTPSDIMTAFEILNYRYNNSDKLITILSSEKDIDDLLEYDRALGSRIYEMSKLFTNIISEDDMRNYRMEG